MRISRLNLTRRRAGAGLLAASLLPLGLSGAQAEVAGDWVSVPNGRVRLIAGGAAPTGDGARYVAIEVQLAPGWKTYWRNPGEAGIPPNFDWAKTQNATPSAITVLYPAPKRIADAGGDLIGYTGGVVFPAIVTPTKASEPVALSVEVAIGICRELCIPVETTLTLSAPPPARDAKVPDVIAKALELAPRPHDKRRALDPELVEVKGTVTDAKGKLLITARRATELFLEGPDGIFVPLPARQATPPSGLEPVTFEVDLAQAPDIKDTLGKPIRLTFVGPGGASEAVWTAK
ncbi:MAG: hypothetical protein RL291_1855 [Pseudomonadota bacterium]